jgi:hypothetical protein
VSCVSEKYRFVANEYQEERIRSIDIGNELSTVSRKTDFHSFMIDACKEVTLTTEENIKGYLELHHPTWRWNEAKCIVSRLRCFKTEERDGVTIYSHDKSKCTNNRPLYLLKRPDQVQSRPRRAKKAYVVPEAPKGVTFFRSVSKRPLQPGEVISESEDEQDEGWLHRLKDATIDKSSRPDASKRFLKVFDCFMHKENLQSDMHMADSLIRFARECGARIWRDEIFDEFKSKLNELLTEKIISIKVRDKALEIVLEQETIAQERTELSRRVSQLDVEPPYDLCYCGKDASMDTGKRTIVTCKDVVRISTAKVRANLLINTLIGLRTTKFPC